MDPSKWETEELKSDSCCGGDLLETVQLEEEMGGTSAPPQISVKLVKMEMQDHYPS